MAPIVGQATWFGCQDKGCVSGYKTSAGDPSCASGARSRDNYRQFGGRGIDRPDWLGRGPVLADP